MLNGYRIAVIIISDRAADGSRPDQTGPRLQEIIHEKGGECANVNVLPDEKTIVRETLLRLAQNPAIDIILTSGGTGIAPRDITVDVTQELLEKEMPGFGEEMRRRSMEVTPYGILSRATAGTIHNTFVLNLPGSPKGAVECLSWVMKSMIHAVKVLKQEQVDCSPKASE